MKSDNFRINSPLPALHFDVFTLFPSMFDGPLHESIIRRARERELISVSLHNIRDYAIDRHHTCDDTPYGGGGGMVMKPESIVRSVETVLSHEPGWELSAQDAHTNLPPWDADHSTVLPGDAAVVLLTPQGRVFTQDVVQELGQCPRLALICGRYEGVDERVRTQLATHEISIGDFVLSGGELAAMVIIDAVTRTVPGALGDSFGAHRDSHSAGLDGLLEGPQYTRPHIFRGESVPDVLLSGNHGHVDQWRREMALLRTFQRRPDLLSELVLSDDDTRFLESHGWSEERANDE